LAGMALQNDVSARIRTTFGIVAPAEAFYTAPPRSRGGLQVINRKARHAQEDG